jgi:hypothetical protein
MLRFREWLISEAAIGPQNVRRDPRGRPNFRVSIRNQGQIIGLEMLQGEGYKYAGDLVSDVFGDANLLKGYRLFNWHSDLPQGGGYGPMFYDIALEIATNNGGHLVSATLVNRLQNVKGAKESKGHAGGDASDAAEGIYKFYYNNRGDVEKVEPNLILMNEPDQAGKPWMYELYRKSPTVLPRLIGMNGEGQPVLVTGTGINAKAVSDMNFGSVQTNPDDPQQQNQQTAQQPQFQGFQTNDPRTWQQRQQHLNSIGIDTIGWRRQEIMRGVKNK